MQQHENDLFDWILSGAYIYVCGAKEPMSADVESTLIEIIQRVGNKTEEQAQGFLNDMIVEGRYLKDVY
jgi:sulfite reductase (NADPH) flavoprotein alpha-component